MTPPMLFIKVRHDSFLKGIYSSKLLHFSASSLNSRDALTSTIHSGDRMDWKTPVDFLQGIPFTGSFLSLFNEGNHGV